MKGRSALTKKEYEKLLREARRKRDRRMEMLLQTLGATGIRVSELPYITVQAVKRGRAEVRCKGKQRQVFLPEALCRALRQYGKERNISAGPLFITRTGKPLDRSNIWREMKGLCEQAGVNPQKVFPHNLRHLFARVFYAVEKNLAHLADVLGHSSIETTRIYVAASAREYEKTLCRMQLII